MITFYQGNAVKWKKPEDLKDPVLSRSQKNRIDQYGNEPFEILEVRDTLCGGTLLVILVKNGQGQTVEKGFPSTLFTLA